MTFSVTFRGSDGRQRHEFFEASSRDALFKMLADKGISAIRVEEASGKQKVFHGNSKKRMSLRPIVWGVVGVLAAAVAFFIFKSLPNENFGDADNAPKQKQIKDVGGIKSTKQQEASEAIAEEPVQQEPEKVVEEQPLTPEEIEAEERRKDPLYDRHHIVAKMPLVKEPIEQLMLSVFTTELGDMPPMLPAIPAFDEERFEKMVNFVTLDEEGDSEEVKLSKEVVNEVKAELSKYLKEGGTTSGFLAYYVNELDKAFHEREMCKELQMKSMKTDEPAVAREVFLKFNERLESKGIKPLTLNRRQKEYLGIED